MKSLALRTAVEGAAVAGLTAISTPASATHPHVIKTPGARVGKAAAGVGAEEPHSTTSFHEQVRKGTPGSFAFERTDNPVSVVGFKLSY